MQVLIRMTMALVLTVWVLPLWAHTLSFSPISQSVFLGGKATVQIRASGLQPTGLGDFDFDVLWDPTVLSFDAMQDGGALGLSFGLDAVTGVGSLTVSDFSLEDPSDLLSAQGDEEVLFTLRFNAIGVGVSALTFGDVALGDVRGQSEQATLETGSIRVVQRTNVSEPNVLWLLSLGLVALPRSRFGCARRTDQVAHP